MNYIASGELGNLAWCGLLLHMNFTYVLRQFDILISYVPSTTYMNLKKSRHQVARLVGRSVGRSVFIESVDLQVIVVFVRAALKPNLSKLNVLR
jgi:hypothetical protein